MWRSLALTPAQAVAVVVSAVGIYCVFLLLIRILGQRTLASLSSFDLAAVIMLGSVAGRAILGYTPTLGAGVLGLATLLVLQAVAGQLRRTRRGAAVVTNRPLLLMAGGEVIGENLRRAHIVEDELWARLRLAGIRNTSELACVVLESTGAVSVLRRGELIDPALLANVGDAARVPAELLLPPSR